MSKRVSRVDASDAIDGMKRIAEMTAKAKGKGIEDGAKMIVDEAKSRARVKTGYMRDHIVYWVEGYPVDSAVIEAQADYSAYQEFGTRYITPNYFMTGAFHTVLPKLAPSVAKAISEAYG